MTFLSQNIDRAIVISQFDLRGFWHPLGQLREDHSKGFSSIGRNLVALARGCAKRNKTPAHAGVNAENCRYEEYLFLCKEFATACDRFQHEAVQLLIKEIVHQNECRRKVVGIPQDESRNYLYPLCKANWWGKITLALAEAFNVNLKLTKASPIEEIRSAVRFNC